MAIEQERARRYAERLLHDHTESEWNQRLEPKPGSAAPKIRNSARMTDRAINRRWEILGTSQECRSELLDDRSNEYRERYRRNIENFVGTVKVPVGIAGPLRMNGLFAQGDYYIPLATSEAALVASYSRGAQVISAAGGCSAMLLNEGLTRAPGFVFRDLRECGRFLVWVTGQMEAFRQCAEATTRHGRLIDMRITVEGNHVYLIFEYLTGDASGQNLATFATQAIHDYILAHSPIRPRRSYVEANLSGDKKASAQSYLFVRGKKVTAEFLLAPSLVELKLRASPQEIFECWGMGAIGSVLTGTIGIQGHFANGLAALYLACGQDVACVAESAVGVSRFEVTPEGELYGCVTLPNLMVGTIGGGTQLPSQRACLEILGLSGQGHAHALAEVAAGLCLSGELSISAAMATGEFSKAHRTLARGKR
ncbi:hydroxymethylglutaryl-CoA reductase [Tautonia marina]|uniref:hydroxymethylglutaryl-CoA reductase n=1 Tax=Tautonia marina TaxID=2653855 RepID=UPI001260601F|nr:hydroxymethylglutaryl-CoA reductase [Tautonia marina]